MERIHYAGGDVLTGTKIARALLDYAEALAEMNDSATVDIPARHEDGSIGRANLLIGPSSQLISETEDSDFDEFEDDALVAQFVEETRRLRSGSEVKPARPDLGHAQVTQDLELGIDLEN